MSSANEFDPRHPHQRGGRNEAAVIDDDGRCLVCCRDRLDVIENELNEAREECAARKARAAELLRDRDRQAEKKQRLYDINVKLNEALIWSADELDQARQALIEHGCTDDNLRNCEEAAALARAAVRPESGDSGGGA